MKQAAVYILSALLLAGAAAAYAELAQVGPGPQQLASAAGKRSTQLTVGGRVSGLYPGARKGLRVRVANGSRRPVTVTAIRAQAGLAQPGCTAKNVRITGYRGKLRVKRHHPRQVRVPITMDLQAPSACQGARFPLSFAVKLRGGH
jgi:hypothetical protein